MVEQPLTGAAGSGGWILVITFKSDNSYVNAGVALDDVSIYPAPTTETPSCPTIVYPQNGQVVNSMPNLQWEHDYSIPGLPTSCTQACAFHIVDVVNIASNAQMSNVTSMNVNGTLLYAVLEPTTQYYWQIVPMGYDGIGNTSCGVYTFTTSSYLEGK